MKLFCLFCVIYFPLGNRLLDQLSQLRSEHLKLSVENEQLRALISGGTAGAGVSIAGVRSGDTTNSKDAQLTITNLEKKLLAQQEELTELHKRKGENSQFIVDLNIKVEKQQQLIQAKEQRYLVYWSI